MDKHELLTHTTMAKRVKALKNLTNDQIIRQLVRELDAMELVILRERLMQICEVTLKNEQEILAGEWNNPIFSANYYIKAMKHINYIVQNDPNATPIESPSPFKLRS